jgi:hypothetical protein
MAGAPKDDLEALWERNRMLREKALGGKLSSQEVQSLPPQLRWPVKLHGLNGPKDYVDRLWSNGSCSREESGRTNASTI